LWAENGDVPAMMENFVFTNNIVACEAAATWSGVRNAGGSTGTTALNSFAPGPEWTWTGNVLQVGASGYPSGNSHAANFAAFDFVNAGAENYELDADSPYKGIAPGGIDPGVNWDELMSRTANVEAGTGYTEGGGGSSPTGVRGKIGGRVKLRGVRL
jgi:hypothetical protein